MLKEQRDICIFQLEEKLDRDSMEECRNFIKIKRESRHYKTLERQRNKLERLCHKKRNAKSAESGHSNIQHGNQNNTVNNNTNWHISDTASPSQIEAQGNSNRWVRNISRTPLTEAQMKLLSHGPNYAVVPKNPPIMEYIAAIEKACTSLQPGKVEELRGEVKANIKKMQPPPSTILQKKSTRLWKSSRETRPG